MTEKHFARPGRDQFRARSIWFTLSGVLLMASFAGSAWAFDGRRQGFALEIGIGPALSSSVPRELMNQPQVDREELRFAVLSRVRVGVGISDRWMLTYVNDVAWALESYRIINEELYATGLTGVGSTVFLGPVGSSWTVEAAVGLSKVSSIGGGVASETGMGIESGIGREMAKGCIARLTFGHAWFGDTEDRSTIGVTVSRIWY